MKATLTILLTLACVTVFAMFDDYEPSPRARAMGGACTAVIDDANACFYNPAVWWPCKTRRSSAIAASSTPITKC
jgi:hypothetical protein